MNKCDIAIIGAGPARMMAAITASGNEKTCCRDRVTGTYTLDGTFLARQIC